MAETLRRTLARNKQQKVSNSSPREQPNKSAVIEAQQWRETAPPSYQGKEPMGCSIHCLSCLVAAAPSSRLLRTCLRIPEQRSREGPRKRGKIDCLRKRQPVFSHYCLWSCDVLGTMPGHEHTLSEQDLTQHHVQAR